MYLISLKLWQLMNQSGVRQHCEHCGESFLSDNLEDCECGRSLCNQCMASHKRETGHQSTNDISRWQTNLRDFFTYNDVKRLDRAILALPAIESVSTFADRQEVYSDVTLAPLPLAEHEFRFYLHRKEVEQPLEKHRAAASGSANTRKPVDWNEFYISRLTAVLESYLAKPGPVPVRPPHNPFSFIDPSTIDSILSSMSVVKNIDTSFNYAETPAGYHPVGIQSTVELKVNGKTLNFDYSCSFESIDDAARDTRNFNPIRYYRVSLQELIQEHATQLQSGFTEQ